MEDYNKQTVEKITRIVCDYFNIDIKLLSEKTRKPEVVKCRQISQDLSYKLIKGVSLFFVGKHTANRNHATVKHSQKTVNNLRGTYKEYDVEYMYIERMVRDAIEIEKPIKQILSELNSEFKTLSKRLHTFTFNPESEVYINIHLCNAEQGVKVVISKINKVISELDWTDKAI
jgi:hypothetical protein